MFSFLKKSSILSALYFLCSALFSCNPAREDLPLPESNDSLPADIQAVNLKIREDRNNPSLYFERAKAYFAHRDVEHALSDVQIALKIDSTVAAYHVFASDLYFTQNKTRDAKNELKVAIALDSAHSEALIKYSQLFYFFRKFDSATIYINKSLHFNKTNPVAHFQKGMILKEWGDTAKAISSFQTAVEYDQQYYDAYMQLGLLHSYLKNPLALGYFDNALQLQQGSVEARYAKAVFLQSTEKYDAALAEYERILKDHPDHRDASYNIAALLYEQNKTDEALKKFELLIARDANFDRAHYGLGMCYEKKGIIYKAKEAYKMALAINPQFEPAAQQLDGLNKRR